MSQARDCDGATLMSQARIAVVGSESLPLQSGLWLVATYLRTSRRCPLCKHAGSGGMCGGAWLVISTRSSFWG